MSDVMDNKNGDADWNEARMYILSTLKKLEKGQDEILREVRSFNGIRETVANNERRIDKWENRIGVVTLMFVGSGLISLVGWLLYLYKTFP